MKIERRFTDAARANVRMGEGDKPKIYGYASVFYNGQQGTEYDIYGDGYLIERIMPGAFDRAVREDDVRALFNHDAARVLGRSKSGTLSLSVDSTGLRYEIDPPNTATAAEVVELLARGDVSGSSFAFLVTDSNPIRKEGGRRILEITGVQLFDVGPVTYPAYTAASSGVRSKNIADDNHEVMVRDFDRRLRERERRLRLLKISTPKTVG